MSVIAKASRPRLNQKVKIRKTGEPGIVKFVVGNVVTVSLIQQEKRKTVNGFFHPSLVINMAEIDW